MTTVEDEQYIVDHLRDRAPVVLTPILRIDHVDGTNVLACSE